MLLLIKLILVTLLHRYYKSVANKRSIEDYKAQRLQRYNETNMVNTELHNKQKEDAVFLQIQKEIEQREREQLEDLERRYSEDDLVFSWACGYESRKREEMEGLLAL
jgi:hypothetical protein